MMQALEQQTPRHFLDLTDVPAKDLHAILAHARTMKAARKEAKTARQRTAHPTTAVRLRVRSPARRWR